jgi:hypothetical protein
LRRKQGNDCEKYLKSIGPLKAIKMFCSSRVNPNHDRPNLAFVIVAFDSVENKNKGKTDEKENGGKSNQLDDEKNRKLTLEKLIMHLKIFGFGNKIPHLLC